MKEIKKDTTLFAVVAKDATKSKLIPAYNAFFEANGINAGALVMNIREDDFGFFMSNVKKSQIKAILLENEFKLKAKEYLDNRDELKSDFIDSFDIIDSKLIGYATTNLAFESLSESNTFNEIENSDYKIIASRALIDIKRWFKLEAKIPQNFDEILNNFKLEKE